MDIKPEAIEAAEEMARQQGLEISGGKLQLVLGAFMEANDPDYAARRKLYSGHAALVSIRKHIAEVEKEAAALPIEEGDWQYKLLFDHLFDGDECAAVEIRDVLQHMDRSLADYYDPDTTYREDAEAYITALDETIEGFRKEIAGQDDPEPAQWQR